MRTKQTARARRSLFAFHLIVTAWCGAEIFAASLAPAKDSSPRPAPVPAINDSFPAGLSQEDRAQLGPDLKRLADKLTLLRSNTISADATKLDVLADADLFHKGVVWALRYETNLTTKDVTLLKHSLQRGHERADALLANQTPWAARK